MSVLVWLSPPVVAVIAATGWIWWRGRPPRPPSAADSMASYQRFRAALGDGEDRVPRS